MAGVESDRAYNALAIRYVNLLDWIVCVREAVSTDTLKICESKNK